MNNREIKVSVKDIPEVIEQLQQAEDKINNLQSKIDKANKLLDKLTSKYILNEDYKKLQEILKETENVENN